MRSNKYEPRFEFDVDGINIVFVNTYSCTEKIYIDGNEIYKKSNITSKKSVIEFENNSNLYRINLDIRSALTGPIECKLYKDNKLVGYKKLITNLSFFYCFWEYNSVHFTGYFRKN